MLNGDALSGLLATSATIASDVGPYAITQGTLDNSNYSIDYVGADLTVVAEPSVDADPAAFGGYFRENLQCSTENVDEWDGPPLVSGTDIDLIPIPAESDFDRDDIHLIPGGDAYCWSRARDALVLNPL